MFKVVASDRLSIDWVATSSPVSWGKFWTLHCFL